MITFIQNLSVLLKILTLFSLNCTVAKVHVYLCIFYTLSDNNNLILLQSERLKCFNHLNKYSDLCILSNVIKKQLR